MLRQSRSVKRHAAAMCVRHGTRPHASHSPVNARRAAAQAATKPAAAAPKAILAVPHQLVAQRRLGCCQVGDPLLGLGARQAYGRVGKQNRKQGRC